jgi:hypothetical protein
VAFFGLLLLKGWLWDPTTGLPDTLYQQKNIKNVMNWCYWKSMHFLKVNDKNDQCQIFIITQRNFNSRSSWASFVVEARIEPSTFRPVSPKLYQLSYATLRMWGGFSKSINSIKNFF